MWQEIEPIFNRALKFSFSRKKLLLVFPVLILCGILIVVCRALSVGAGSWVWVSLAFLPLFLCVGILLAAAVPLIRLYHDEVKGRPLKYRQTIFNSWKLMMGISSFTAPLILGYLVLWIVFGVFYLFKAIPKIGHTLGVVLSFAPFLLIFGSLALSVLTLLLLFFVTPQVALKSEMHWEMAEKMLYRIRENFFSHLVMLVLGLVPLLIAVGFLILAAAMTGLAYFTAESAWAVAFQWFFIMIPFAALVSPAAVFFFNFAAESFAWMQKRAR